ncbi:MAG: hypothetical protein WBC06_12160 [Chitinophagaceae bacterium]
MKKTFLIVAFIFGGFIFQVVAAQLRGSTSVNFGSQHVWGTTEYNYASFFYLPDIDLFNYVL